MTVNVKHLLSGLEKHQFYHPTVKKIVDLMLDEYDRTSVGVRNIRWVEETYEVKLLNRNNQIIRL